MRKPLFWAAAGLLPLLAFGVVWARQEPETPPVPAIDVPTIEEPTIEEPPTESTRGEAAFLIEAAASPEPAPPPDPLDQVNQLSEQIRGRRGEDEAAVTALIGQLEAQAEEQRAALARTEEALNSARGLQAEISAGPSVIIRAEPGDMELTPPPAAGWTSPDEPPLDAEPEPAGDAPPLPTAEIVPLLDLPPAPDEARIADLERRIAELTRELEQLRRP